MPDLEELSREWLRSYEDRIRKLPGIDQVVITVQETTALQRLVTIPVSDLVPNLPLQKQPREQGKNALFSSVEQEDKESGAGPIAISHGGDLVAEEENAWTLTETLMKAAELSPNEGILYINNDGSEDFQSYAKLWEDAGRILTGLRRLGLRPKDKVIFQFPDNRNFISAFWGCVLGGIIPVPIGIALTYSEINSSINKLMNTWSMLGKPYILTNKKLYTAIDSVPKLTGIPGIQAVTVEELSSNERDPVVHESHPEDTALMMLTSGSTGTPKGVLLSHKNLISRSAGSVQKNGFSRKDITLNWMPLDHVAGIIFFHLRDVFTRCQQIHVASQRILENPLKWIDLMDQYRVTVSFAPNFAFGLVNKQEEEMKGRKWDLSSIQFLLNGGEAIVPKTARRFMELLIPHGLIGSAMRPAWGMSETSSGVVYSDRFSVENVKDGDSFVEVGKPIPGVSVRIVDKRGDVLGESKIGRLQVRGWTVMQGYYNNPQANAEAFTGDGWFDTGDLAVIQDGQLTITGRGKDEIIINGVNYYPHEIESAVESIEGVEASFTAACAVRSSDDDTDKLAIFFHSAYQEWDRQIELVSRIRMSIVKEFGLFPSYVIPVAKERIPKTEIGKIQRSQLGKRFVEGEFDHLIRKVEAGQGMGDTVPDWFYRKVWNPTSIDGAKVVPTDGYYLIFMDDLGLGAKVVQVLKNIGQKCIQCERGERFRHLAEDKFLLSVEAPEDYERLTALLNKRGVFIDNVLHLWGYSAYRPVDDLAGIRNAQERGVYSLLALIRNLKQPSRTRKSIRLIVATSHVQAATPDRPIAYEKSALPGFLRAAALDLPWLQCRHIDLEVTGMDGKYLLDELACADSETEIAYRNGKRMKSYLSRIDMLEEKPGRLPLAMGGLYLLTGGLGGVGSYIAQRLMTDYRAKLVLLGRTTLPERSLWDQVDQERDRVTDRIRAYQNLESISRRTGGEFVYDPADISNYSQIEVAAARAESRWGMAISGIFHLAGDLNIAHHWETAESHRIGSEGRDAYEAMFKAKVYGTWNLFQIIKRRPEAIFVGFSSVVSELGAATFGAYCAGNSFLDGCCRYHHHTLPQKVFSFNWSMWEETGMSRDNPEYSKQAALSMGNMDIEPESGWNSLLAGLCRNDPQVLVGLNGLNPHIRSHLDKGPKLESRLSLYVATPRGGSMTDGLREQLRLVLRDTNYPFEITEVKKIPALEDGSVDMESLQLWGPDKAAAGMESAAPRTDAEKKIAAIWKEVLGVKKIRVNINFFDSGGTSIQLAQVNAQLKAAFGRNISMTELFKFPTISSLAEFLTSSTSDSLSASLTQSEERAAGRKAKMLIRKRGGKSPLDKREKK